MEPRQKLTLKKQGMLLSARPQSDRLSHVVCLPCYLLPHGRKSKQPGPIMRLLSCTDDALKTYKNMDLAPTMPVPSMSFNPKTGEW